MPKLVVNASITLALETVIESDDVGELESIAIAECREHGTVVDAFVGARPLTCDEIME